MTTGQFHSQIRKCILFINLVRTTYPPIHINSSTTARAVNIFYTITCIYESNLFSNNAQNLTILLHQRLQKMKRPYLIFLVRHILRIFRNETNDAVRNGVSLTLIKKILT